MIIEKIIVGEYQTNCYIISKENECLIIDPGDEYYKIEQKIANKKVLAILITHSHHDHIGAVDAVVKQYNAAVLKYENLEEKNYKIGDFDFDVIYTKGHSDDSVTYYFQNDNIMFTGDFIFENTIGRTDLPTGNYESMLKSIELIKKFDDSIIIYPGHGNSTKLGIEKLNNYWFDDINQ